MFALWSSTNHIPIKYRGAIKKTNHLRPIYLRPSVPHLGQFGFVSRLVPLFNCKIVHFWFWWETTISSILNLLFFLLVLKIDISTLKWWDLPWNQAPQSQAHVKARNLLPWPIWLYLPPSLKCIIGPNCQICPQTIDWLHIRFSYDIDYTIGKRWLANPNQGCNHPSHNFWELISMSYPLSKWTSSFFVNDHIETLPHPPIMLAIKPRIVNKFWPCTPISFSVCPHTAPLQVFE